MYGLIQAADNTFYMDCPTKVGFCKISEDEVVLIDSGSDKDAGMVNYYFDNNRMLWQRA